MVSGGSVSLLPLLAWSCLLIAGCGADNRCSADDECINSQVAKDLGRCSPKEAYCRNNSCVAACRPTCTTANSTINAVDDTTLVCNEGLLPRELNYCTALPIGCTTLDECPMYRPTDSQGVQHQWTCESQVCRYPGLQYSSELD